MDPLNTDVGGGGLDSGAGLTESVNTDTQPTGGAQQAPTGDNPAWGELLGVLPTSLHSQVKPFLEKWDNGVQTRLTSVQSQYEPYKDFLGTDPAQIQASLQLAQMIATDPRAFYDRMAEHYGAEWGLDADQGLGADNADDYSLEGLDDEGIDLENNPLIRQLREQQDTIASFLATQVEQQQAAEQERLVSEAGTSIQTELADIAKANNMESLPPEAERMILEIAVARGADSLGPIAEQVMPLFTAQANPRPTPRIVAPGGGVPSNNVDVAKMSAPDTKSLVATILAQQAAANRG